MTGVLIQFFANPYHLVSVVRIPNFLGTCANAFFTLTVALHTIANVHSVKCKYTCTMQSLLQCFLARQTNVGTAKFSRLLHFPVLHSHSRKSISAPKASGQSVLVSEKMQLIYNWGPYLETHSALEYTCSMSNFYPLHYLCSPYQHRESKPCLWQHIRTKLQAREENFSVGRARDIFLVRGHNQSFGILKRLPLCSEFCTHARLFPSLWAPIAFQLYSDCT